MCVCLGPCGPAGGVTGGGGGGREERKLIRAALCVFPLLFRGLLVNCSSRGGECLGAQFSHPLPGSKPALSLACLGLPESGAWWENFEQLLESEQCLLGLAWVR